MLIGRDMRYTESPSRLLYTWTDINKNCFQDINLLAG